MKKFEVLGRSLSKGEQKKVSGGKAACSCTCTHGSTGEWVYDNSAQPFQGQLMSDIDAYCSSGGGYCTNCTSWDA